MSSPPLFINKRYLTILSRVFKNHYDTLKVSSKATQSDIKAAYYKLSMIYHPDKNKGSKEAAEKFQSINSAYEVLGNYKRRRLYDRGLLVDKVSPEGVQKESKSPFDKQRPVSTGRHPIYNFDEWSRAHYGQTFARRSAAKKEYDKKVEMEINAKRDQAMVVLLVGFVILIVVSTLLKDNFDKVSKFNSNDKQKNDDSEKKN